MENPAFTDKDNRYYNIEKSRMVSLIPEGPNVILDLGCATGRLGRKLRELNKTTELVGVEIYALVINAQGPETAITCPFLQSMA